jgi:hypothetical protein
MAATKRKTTRTKIPKLGQSAAAVAARKALITADLLGLESGQARLSGLSKGAYGSPQIRAGGTSISTRYLIGKGKAYKAPKASPKGKGKR